MYPKRARRWNEQNKGGERAGRRARTFAVAWISLHREFDRLSCIRHLAVNCREEPRSRNCPYAYWMFVLPSVIQCADIDTPGTRGLWEISIDYLLRSSSCSVKSSAFFRKKKKKEKLCAIVKFSLGDSYSNVSVACGH